MADASGFRHWALLSPSQDLTTIASKKKKPSPRQCPPQRPAVSEAPFAKPLAPRPRPPPAPRTRSTNPDATQKNVTAFLAAFQALNIQKRQIAILRKQLKAELGAAPSLNDSNGPRPGNRAF